MTMKELYERIQTKKSIQHKLEDMYLQKEDLENRVYHLETQMHKEQDDVDRLEKGGLASFIYDLMGQKEKRLDKELQEAYEAKVKYNNATYQLNVLNGDIAHYEKQLESISQDENKYQELFNQRQQLLKDQPEVMNLEEKISESQVVKKEILEALEVGNHCLNILMTIKEHLNSAEGYATWDLVGGGLLADMAKYSALDKAEASIRQLQLHLNRFRTELTDIKITSDVSLSMDEFLRMADYFFDNIFTDFTVMNRITKSKHQIQEVGLQVEEVVAHLNELLAKENTTLQSLNQRLEQIIINS